jgi:hypothetical protein
VANAAAAGDEVPSRKENTMDGKCSAAAVAILISLVILSHGCQSAPPPVVPGISGTHLSQGADIRGDEKTVQAILSVFKQAEDAVHRKDLDALMELYSENYSHGGYTKDSIRAVWSNLFEQYRDFSGAHIFSAINVDARKTQSVAHVTCTGNLWAISNETGQRVNIDSWFGEAHHLVFEREAWRLAGTFWEIPRAKESRPLFLPHPFF